MIELRPIAVMEPLVTVSFNVQIDASAIRLLVAVSSMVVSAPVERNQFLRFDFSAETTGALHYLYRLWGLSLYDRSWKVNTLIML